MKGNNNLIFIDGPGGTGKTFLYTVIIYYYLSENKQVISMAWTGIAFILLPNLSDLERKIQKEKLSCQVIMRMFIK